MNHSEFVDALAKKVGLTQKAAKENVDAFWEIVASTIKKGDEVAFPYGKFELRKKPARTGRNPVTGEEIKIKAKVVPAFKAGKKFKDLFAK
jgi:DNA-binding protein HU-beta